RHPGHQEPGSAAGHGRGPVRGELRGRREPGRRPSLRLGRPEGEVVVSFLDVKDLKIHFPTDDGIVRSVDGLTFSVERGRTLGIVGESGSGKSVTSLGILGLHKGGRARISGEILLDGQDLVAMSAEQVRGLRGKRMAMIFQDPLSAMHPYYTVGHQIVEAYRI